MPQVQSFFQAWSQNRNVSAVRDKSLNNSEFPEQDSHKINKKDTKWKTSFSE